MTREEAIDIIKCLAWHTRPNEEDIEQAIKELEQEPCEDCISRKAVLDAFWKLDVELTPSAIDVILDMVNNLPPVIPQEPTKTGHWISNAEDDLKISDYTCSNCKGLSDDATDFCPKCGSYNGGEKKMNAQELTERYHVDHQRVNDLEKQVGYLTQKLEKLRLIIKDAQIDIQMLQRR